MKMIHKVCDKLNKIIYEKCEQYFFRVTQDTISLTKTSYANPEITIHLWDVLKMIDETENGYIRLNYSGPQIQIAGNWMPLAEELGVHPAYSVGDQFLIDGTAITRTALLVNLGMGNVVLVSIDTGNRWAETIKVSDVYNITQEELERLSGGYKLTKI